MHTALIVDDDPKNRKIINAYLSKDNFTVFEADNADEAFRLLSGLVPDLILMDFQMPGLNGIETIERIRETNIYTCIIMMTAYTSQEVVIGAIRSQADDFLSKPLNFKELGNICRSAIIKRRELFPIDTLELTTENETLFSALVVSNNNSLVFQKDPIDSDVLKDFKMNSFDLLYTEILNFLNQISTTLRSNSDESVVQELRIARYYVFYIKRSDLIVFMLLTENQYNLLIEFEVIEIIESVLNEIMEIMDLNNDSSILRSKIDDLLTEITSDFAFSDS